MRNMMSFLIVVIVIQLFYAMSIVLITQNMPEESLQYSTMFMGEQGTFTLTETGDVIDNSLQRQTNIPIIDLGALVFYSGNILIDLFFNFAFAIPQMIGMLINGIVLLFNLPSEIVGVVQIFASVIVMSLYVIGIIQTIIGIRSGRFV